MFFFLLGEIIAESIITLGSILIVLWFFKSIMPAVVSAIVFFLLIIAGVIDVTLSVKLIRIFLKEEKHFGLYLRGMKLIMMILMLFSQANVPLLIMLIIDSFVSSKELWEYDNVFFIIIVEIVSIIAFFVFV